jgi:Asp-tRNA(Asn)/Glu-tRNA(Gln) amidotransferase C subunit
MKNPFGNILSSISKKEEPIKSDEAQKIIDMMNEWEKLQLEKRKTLIQLRDSAIEQLNNIDKNVIFNIDTKNFLRKNYNLPGFCNRYDILAKNSREARNTKVNL